MTSIAPGDFFMFRPWRYSIIRASRKKLTRVDRH
jgi:hypothetical protein